MSQDMSSRNTDRTEEAGRPTAAGSRGRGAAAALATVGIFGVALGVGLVPRLRLQPQLAHAAEAQRIAKPVVTVVQPKQPPRTDRLDLPGNIEPMEETTVSARANGYLKQWFVDIGDHVRAGQLMAVIQAPDADALTAQARAQVAGSDASLQQSRANVVSAQANADNARAGVARAEAALRQAEAQLSQAQASYAQGTAQMKQQQANLLQQQANRDLAKVTADRYDYLVGQGAIAKQTADQQTAAYKTAQAGVEAAQSAIDASSANAAALRENIRSAEANVKAAQDGVAAARATLAAAQASVSAGQAGIGAAAANVSSNLANYQHNAVLQGFQNVTAPFDGIVTARNVDVGSLVSASGGPTAAIVGPEATAASGGLFTMQRTDHVRIFVSVPQSFIGALHPGEKAQVVIAALGSRPFAGTVVRNASSLDAASRTLLTEIQLPNAQGLLRPGMFATVRFDVPRTEVAWRIPDSALITDANGTSVAIVTPEGKIHFQPVTVGTDYGKEMDITEGLTGKETLVANPNASLVEGMEVQTVAAPVLKGPGSAGGPGAGGGGSHRQ